MNNEAEPSAPENLMGDTVTTIRRVERQPEVEIQTSAASDTDADAQIDSTVQAETQTDAAGDELLLDTEIEVDFAPEPTATATATPTAARPSSVPPPPPLAAMRSAARSSWPAARTRSSTPPPFESVQPRAATPAPNDSNVELLATRAELERVARRMRARDAYLVELERAFDVSNRQIETSRLRNAADMARLTGRVRGQAFRIAELEAELRQAIVALATERGSMRPRGLPNQDDLQLIRGIGPRFEAQLRAMGITTLQSVAQWTAGDVVRVAEQLSIQPQRIERDAWIDQARALSTGPE